MSTHVFAALLTGQGTAANNRGQNEGNITTLQKLVWGGQVHTTVSAESIRFALRRRLRESADCNRNFNEESRENEWKDPKFSGWDKGAKGTVYIDDDLLGFMQAEGAKQDGEKGSARIRRAVLEVTRAVSLEPWPGDVTFNAASPGATPSAAKGKDQSKNPVPYGTEMHATRYQYAVAMTPERLRDPAAAVTALRGLCGLGEVAGNHGRFLFDFSPESVVFRITQEAAPRILYCYSLGEDGKISIAELLRKVSGGDIKPQELLLGGAIVDGLDAAARALLKDADLKPGVLQACELACQRLTQKKA